MSKMRNMKTPLFPQYLFTVTSNSHTQRGSTQLGSSVISVISFFLTGKGKANTNAGIDSKINLKISVI